MTITLEAKDGTAYMIGTALQREMKRRYEEQCFMASQGFGKEFWAKTIDNLADLYLQFREQYYNS